MIYEYAIQPEVLIEWAKSQRDYREFFHEYGLGTPRILSSFPKQKVGKLRSYLLQLGPKDSASRQSKRYQEMVEAISREGALVLRETKSTVSHDEWEKLVLVENRINKFDVILAKDALAADNCIPLEKIYDNGSGWEHKTQFSFYRKNEELYGRLRNMMHLSRKIMAIIDPYSWAGESIEFICFALNKLYEECNGYLGASLYVIYKKDVKNREAAPVSVNIVVVFK